MSNFFQLIAENKSVHPVIPIEGFIIIVWLIAVVVFGCVRRSKIPKINPDEILHEEKWRSGRSNRSILTRFGGARNCLDIKFLKDKIVIRPHFPFDLFRAEIEAETKLGKLADKYLKAGKLVPNKLTVGLVEKAIKQKASSFIIDGFPRNRRQLNDLLAVFRKAFKKNDQVYAIEVAVSDREVKQRLGQRRGWAFGENFPLGYKPPPNPCFFLNLCR